MDPPDVEVPHIVKQINSAKQENKAAHAGRKAESSARTPESGLAPGSLFTWDKEQGGWGVSWVVFQGISPPSVLGRCLRRRKTAEAPGVPHGKLCCRSGLTQAEGTALFSLVLGHPQTIWVYLSRTCDVISRLSEERPGWEPG